MGKTPKPLKILVSSEVWIGSEVPLTKLRDQGHTVEVMSMNLGSDRKHICPLTDEWDLILAPQACRWLPGMEFVLDDVIKGARAIKYPIKKEARAGTISRGGTQNG